MLLVQDVLSVSVEVFKAVRDTCVQKVQGHFVTLLLQPLLWSALLSNGLPPQKGFISRGEWLNDYQRDKFGFRAPSLGF